MTYDDGLTVIIIINIIIIGYRPSIITAARPAYAGTEGCFGLLVFFLSFFI